MACLMYLSDNSSRNRVPKHTYELLWKDILTLVNQSLVSGFATTKKCSNEGRALMQLDHQQFLSKLEKITPVIPPPDFVNAYIKAYYLPEENFENWLTAHARKVKKILRGTENLHPGRAGRAGRAYAM